MAAAITLGSQIRDKVSKVTGKVLGRAEYLYSSPKLLIGLEATESDGRPTDTFWLDEARAELLVPGRKKPYGLGKPGTIYNTEPVKNPFEV